MNDTYRIKKRWGKVKLMDEKKIYKWIWSSVVIEKIQIDKEKLMKYVDEVENKNTNTKMSIVCKMFKFGVLKGSEKYNLAKEIMEMTINDREIEKREEKHLDDILLSKILGISTCMDIKLKDILNVVYKYIKKNGATATVIKQINLSLKKIKSKEEEERFKSFFEKNIENLYVQKDIMQMEHILEELQKNKSEYFAEKKVVQTLLDMYIEMAQKNSGIDSITYIQKGLEVARKIKDRKNEEKFLILMEINVEKIEFEEMSNISIEDENMEAVLRECKKLLNEYLEENDIGMLIRKCGEKAIYQKNKRVVIYSPYIEYNEELGEESEFIFLKMMPMINLQENRVSSIGNGEEKIIKEVMNLGHINQNVLPYIECIYRHNVIALKEIRNFFKECNLEETEAYEYYLKVEKYFGGNSFVESMTFGSILVEKLLRHIYRLLKNYEITPKRIDPRIQIEINLQDIFKESEIVKILGGDLTKYFRYVLIDEEGYNIRNKIAHGLMKCDEFERWKELVIIHIILVLLYKIKKIINFQNSKYEIFDFSILIK